MDRIRPTLQNKTEIPINNYKGEELLIECPSIQQAAKFFKKHTGSKRFNWAAINKGIWYNEQYAFNDKKVPGTIQFLEGA